MIELPSRAVHDYVASFNLGCIYFTAAGKLGVGRDLSRASPIAAAWWCRDRRSAEEIMVAIGAAHPTSVEQAVAEITATAAPLDVALTEHAAVLARAKAAIRKFERQLAMANGTGALAFFNAEYQRRRLAARAVGKRFMTYREAHWRLRKALAAAAADGPMPDLVQQVFDG